MAFYLENEKGKLVKQSEGVEQEQPEFITKTQAVDLIVETLRNYNEQIVMNKDLRVAVKKKIILKSDQTSSAEINFAFEDPGFAAEGNKYKIYLEASNGDLILDPQTDGGNGFVVGDVNKPIHAYIIGTDEGVLKADNNTNDCTFLVEPTKASFAQSGSNLFRLGLPNHSSEPSTCVVGDLCVHSGVLKVCTAANTWTVVGTQT